MNIGNPVERSILEFAEEVKRLTHSAVAIKKLPGRVDDPKRRCPDISRAKKELAWEPKVDLSEGLSRTLEYFKASL